VSRLVLICSEGLLLADAQVPLERAAVSDTAAEAVARLCGASIACILVSAPPPLAGGGEQDSAMRARLHERLRDGLARRGARLEAILVPSDGLAATFAKALEQFRAAAAGTPVLCESLAALEAAASLGCPRILLRTSAGRSVQAAGIPDRLLPVGVQADLAAAVEPVLRLLR
jgi:D-glycero-D-manno-heptose 1,7-bisphosphate phosphatase